MNARQRKKAIAKYGTVARVVSIDVAARVITISAKEPARPPSRRARSCNRPWFEAPGRIIRFDVDHDHEHLTITYELDAAHSPLLVTLDELGTWPTELLPSNSCT